MSARAKCILILLLFDFQIAFPHGIANSIQELFKASNPPLLVVLNADQRHGTVYDVEERDSSSEGNPDDEGAYFLYHLLRTTQENEPLDPEATRTFEKTKAVLREALRSRCNRLKRCVKRCVKKVYTCTVTCREEYDVYDLCQLPVCQSNYCGKRGKTMPPYWLL